MARDQESARAAEQLDAKDARCALNKAREHIHRLEAEVARLSILNGVIDAELARMYERGREVGRSEREAWEPGMREWFTCVWTDVRTWLKANRT
jgi:hypothetical protein